MSDPDSRRFTDEEVAVVLRKAAELDEERGTKAGTGLTRTDLEEIAREVGISADSLSEAVDHVRNRASTTFAIAGAPLSRSAVHSIEGQLSEEGLARLIGVIDQHAESNGVVSEALGSVRWTGADRFKSTQVSITPAGGETSIRVVEKAAARLRRVVTLIPGVWGLALAGSVVSATGADPVGTGAIIALGAGLGVAAGRTAWRWMSRASGVRVEKLAEELAHEARDAAGSGLVDPLPAPPDDHDGDS